MKTPGVYEKADPTGPFIAVRAYCHYKGKLGSVTTGLNRLYTCMPGDRLTIDGKVLDVKEVETLFLRNITDD